jgi:hypothetical protein
MMGRSHSICGLTAGLAVGLLVSSPVIGLACGAVGWLASWGPDLDHPAGLPARILGPITWLACRLIRGISAAVGLPKHRGISHAAIAALGCGVLVGLLAAVWQPTLAARQPGSIVIFGAAASAGYAAALAGDWLTKSSLPWLLWPIVARTPGPPNCLRIRTGGVVEQLLVFGLVAPGCALLVAVTIGVLP